MGITNFLFGKKGENDAKKKETANTSGFLTKEEIHKLKIASQRTLSPLRKKSYKTWVCNMCKHAFFYTVARCPLCESTSIMETEHQTQYEVKNIEAD